MTLSGLARTLVAVATATALGLSAAPGQARAAADGPDFGAPAVGACSTMTAEQADARVDRSTVVPCSQAHQAKVAGVVRLPDGLAYSSRGKLYRAMVKRCKPAWNELLGRTHRVRDSSAYQLVWFVPSKDQRQHGARWMSCSVVLRKGNELAKLPANKAPLLPKGELGDRIHRCLLATTASTITTRCSAEHGWRATGSFVVSSETFPGTTAVNRAARTKCPRLTNPRKPFRWTYWTKVNWQAGGDHAVICYTKTKS
ncbi:MAG TPA: septum formation family protein [Nocardioides sp.]|nr:septum formation family protein [Nocardioides sp.]